MSAPIMDAVAKDKQPDELTDSHKDFSTSIVDILRTRCSSSLDRMSITEITKNLPPAMQTYFRQQKKTLRAEIARLLSRLPEIFDHDNGDERGKDNFEYWSFNEDYSLHCTSSLLQKIHEWPATPYYQAAQDDLLLDVSLVVAVRRISMLDNNERQQAIRQEYEPYRRILGAYRARYSNRGSSGAAVKNVVDFVQCASKRESATFELLVDHDLASESSCFGGRVRSPLDTGLVAILEANNQIAQQRLDRARVVFVSADWEGLTTHRATLYWLHETFRHLDIRFTVVTPNKCTPGTKLGRADGQYDITWHHYKLDILVHVLFWGLDSDEHGGISAIELHYHAKYAAYLQILDACKQIPNSYFNEHGKPWVDCSFISRFEKLAMRLMTASQHHDWSLPTHWDRKCRLCEKKWGELNRCGPDARDLACPPCCALMCSRAISASGSAIVVD